MQQCLPQVLQKVNLQSHLTDTKFTSLSKLKAPKCSLIWSSFSVQKYFCGQGWREVLTWNLCKVVVAFSKVHRNIMSNWGDALDPGGNGFRVLSCHDVSLLTAEWAFSVALLGQSTSQMRSVCWCWRAICQPRLPQDPSSQPLVPRCGLHTGTFQPGHPSALASSFCCVAGDCEHRGMRWAGGFPPSVCSQHCTSQLLYGFTSVQREGGRSRQTELLLIYDGVKHPVNAAGAKWGQCRPIKKFASKHLSGTQHRWVTKSDQSRHMTKSFHVEGRGRGTAIQRVLIFSL